MDEEYKRYRAEQSAEHLDHVRGIALRVISLKHSIEEQRAIAEGVTGIDYAKDMVSTSPTDNHMPHSVQRLQDLIAEKEALCHDYEIEIRATYSAIDKMKAPECAAALEMHYLGGKSWTRCAAELGYTKQGMMDLRRRALCDFFDFIPGPKHVEIPSAV